MTWSLETRPYLVDESWVYVCWDKCRQWWYGAERLSCCCRVSARHRFNCDCGRQWWQEAEGLVCCFGWVKDIVPAETLVDGDGKKKGGGPAVEGRRKILMHNVTVGDSNSMKLWLWAAAVVWDIKLSRMCLSDIQSFQRNKPWTLNHIPHTLYSK